MSDVLLLIDNDRNSGLLHEHLCDDHAPVRIRHGEPLEGAYDLALVDIRNLRARQDDLEAWKESQHPLVTPVLLLVSSRERERLSPSVWDHVDDVATMPIRKDVLTARLGNLLQRRRLSEIQQRYLDSIEIFNQSLQEQVTAKTEKLRESFTETVLILTRAAESRDHETGAHINRISEYSRCLAKALGMDDAFVETMAHASPMHDIGKIGIPDNVLLKPGSLTPEEWSVMKEHTIIGERILRDAQSVYLQMGADIARSHHERWDGSGYPDGLSGEDIPLPARIMNVCDVYDALRSRRPYKAGFDHATAVRLITEGDDRTRPEHFDPAALDAFARIADDFAAIFDEYDELKADGARTPAFRARFASFTSGKRPR